MHRVSPLRSAIFYFIMGAIFIYFAFQTIDETVFKPLTILLVILATLEFGVGIRFLQFHIKIKRHQKK
ncbi:YdiK family protein [Amphibacillus indicireducens]|uniref:DUF4305 domain-containing protein n=1 Tax=Amphibacillus indicireducens TaxID=1076330 RepID=A0ABP7VSH4_9BACI